MHVVSVRYVYVLRVHFFGGAKIVSLLFVLMLCAMRVVCGVCFVCVGLEKCDLNFGVRCLLCL